MLSGPLFQSPFIISHRSLRDKKLNLIDENVHVQLISKKRNFARFTNPCTSGCDYTTKLSSPAHLLALSMGCPFSGLLMHPQKWEPGRGCKNLPRGFSRYTRAVGKATDQVLPPDSDVCCPDRVSPWLWALPQRAAELPELRAMTKWANLRITLKITTRPLLTTWTSV